MVIADVHSTGDVVEMSHEFEVEVNRLVTENHVITLRGIQQSEDELVKHLGEELAGEDPEIMGSQIRHARQFHEDLKHAANHSALVTLVTRLEHWTRRFVKKAKLKTEKSRPPVIRDMEALNKLLGDAPVPVKFFEELVTARDSVIHADSHAEWGYKGKRRVADKYINASEELAFGEEHLREAVERAITQIKWYDERLSS